MRGVTLHFDTRPEWIDVIREWAASDDRISQVWVFGSRATGRRSAKPNASPVPDLDIGYVLRGTSEGDRLAYAMCMLGEWREWLADRIPVTIDLQYTDKDIDRIVWPAIKDHGVMVFRRG
ncbi:MAG: hypothetical protein ACK5QD_03070 [Brevundimonas sp.]|uniref:hypothetical protein n=1 Tax=Brevundimonas sp. TaxID=1871086 RepID=UPI00391D9F1B